MDHFLYRDGVLHAEDVAVAEIAAAVRGRVESVLLTALTDPAAIALQHALAEAIGERARNEGGAAAVAYFNELRAEHYGGPGYDFRPGPVAEVAFAVGDADATRPVHAAVRTS